MSEYFSKTLFLILLLAFNSTYTEELSYLSPFVENYVYANDKTREQFLNDLPTKDKVGQLFLSIVYGDAVGENQRDYLDKSRLGNIILFNSSNQLDSFEQVRSLSHGLSQHITNSIGILPFISLDQEGGAVQRLREGFSDFPGNMALAATGDLELAARQGIQIGKELKAAGINMNLAPVVDVNTCMTNPIIGTRSFSNDPTTVNLFATALIKGMKSQAIVPVLKHFPGHGGAETDTHLDVAVINKSIEEMRAVDLQPFKLLSQEAGVVMGAHVLYPEIDKENIATLSARIIKGILREELGFQGISMTDSLVMNGVVGKHDSFEKAKHAVAEACVRAFEAGNDMFIVAKLEWQEWEPTPEQDQEVVSYCIDYFNQKVLAGEISISELNQSVSRILNLKKELFLKQVALNNEENGVVDSVAEQVAKKSITLLSTDKSYIDFFTKDNLRYLIVASENLKAVLQRVSKNSQLEHYFYFINSKATDQRYLKSKLTDIQSLSVNYDKVIFLVDESSWNPTFNYFINEFVAAEGNLNKGLVVGLGFPYDLLEANISNKLLIYQTYSDSENSLNKLFTLLKNKVKPQGHLPLKNL